MKKTSEEHIERLILLSDSDVLSPNRRHKLQNDRTEQEQTQAFQNKCAEIAGAFDRLGVENTTGIKAIYNLDGTVQRYYIDNKE